MVLHEAGSLIRYAWKEYTVVSNAITRCKPVVVGPNKYVN